MGASRKKMQDTHSPDDQDMEFGAYSSTMLQAAIKQGNTRRDAFFVVQVGKSAVAVPFQLPIPADFAKYHQKLIAENITLQAPSGRLWKVTIRAAWFFPRIGRGWKQFSLENGIPEGCQLLFTLVGRTRFVVQFFDRYGRKRMNFLPPQPTASPSSAYVRHSLKPTPGIAKPRVAAKKLSASSSSELIPSARRDDEDDDKDAPPVRRHSQNLRRGFGSRKLQNGRAEMESYVSGLLKKQKRQLPVKASARLTGRGFRQRRPAARYGDLSSDEAPETLGKRHKEARLEAYTRVRNRNMPEVENTIARDGSKAGGPAAMECAGGKTYLVLDSDEEDEPHRPRVYQPPKMQHKDVIATSGAATLYLDEEGKLLPLESSKETVQTWKTSENQDLREESLLSVAPDDVEFEDMAERVESFERDQNTLHNNVDDGDGRSSGVRGSGTSDTLQDTGSMEQRSYHTPPPMLPKADAVVHVHKKMVMEVQALHENLESEFLGTTPHHPPEPHMVANANHEMITERERSELEIKNLGVPAKNWLIGETLAVPPRDGTPHTAANDLHKTVEVEKRVLLKQSESDRIAGNRKRDNQAHFATHVGKNMRRQTPALATTSSRPPRGARCRDAAPAALAAFKQQNLHKASTSSKDVSKKTVPPEHGGSHERPHFRRESIAGGSGESLSPAQRLLAQQGCATFSQIVRAESARRRSHAATSAERNRAVQAGERCARALQNASFMVVLGDAQVYHTFHLTVPLEFLQLTGTLRATAMKVCLVDRSQNFWKANWRRAARSPAPRLSSDGWAHFALDHTLEDGDVCVFELMDTHPSFLFLVHISRAAAVAESDADCPRRELRSAAATNRVKDGEIDRRSDGAHFTRCAKQLSRAQESLTGKDGTKKRPASALEAGPSKKRQRGNLHAWTKMFNTSLRDKAMRGGSS